MASDNHEIGSIVKDGDKLVGPAVGIDDGGVEMLTGYPVKDTPKEGDAVGNG